MSKFIDPFLGDNSSASAVLENHGSPFLSAADFHSIFRKLCEQAPDALLVSDAQGKILFASQQTTKLFGYQESELLGASIEILMPERFRGGHATQRTNYALAPSVRPMGVGLDLYGLRKDGSEFPVEISLSPLRASSGTVFASAVRNISEQKRMEGLLQSQLNFQTLMSRLSGTFLNVPANKLDQKLTEALCAVGEFMDFDRICLGKLDHSSRLEVLSSWARPGVPTVTFHIANDYCPWLVHRVWSDGIVHVSSPDDLPSDATKDRQYMLATGEKSILGITLTVAGDKIGVISFATFRQNQEWTSLLISRLQQVADVFSNVLQRTKSNDDLQHAYSRIEELNRRLEQENHYLRQEIRLEHNHANIVGQSAAIRNVLKQAEQVAATDSVVLIQGETGTGKELLARTIHDLSTRKLRSMVKINCAALPATLIESELFGREKGAYTGALTREIGRFELADKSTIFLDEIGELPVELQAKLLRVLQEGEFERLGSPKTIRVDVRVIAATNRDLAAAVADGKFREDLFYRLSVFPIHLPPLRERREDVPELVWHILQDLGKRMGKNIQGIQSSTLKAFQNYAWPGNIRELRNVIERNLILTAGPLFRAKLPEFAARGTSTAVRIDDVERQHILRVLRSTAWRVRGQSGAATLLGLKPTTLESRMKKLNIRREN